LSSDPVSNVSTAQNSCLKNGPPALGILKKEAIMARGLSCFMLFLIFFLAAGASPNPAIEYGSTAWSVAKGQDKKDHLKDYLARSFSKSVSMKKGCMSISVPSETLFKPHSQKVNPANWEGSIASVAHVCRRYPRADLIIAVYTDCLHSEEQNLALSELQAWTIKQALVDRGIGAEKIRAQGWGESRPVASNATPEGRKANNRIMMSFGPACEKFVEDQTKPNLF
jgi:outer membrane protein OmpA-like peptidoglycan-associated protein